MKPIVLSLRLPGDGSAASKFADTTHDWLDEFVDDYEQRTGEVYEGGNGVLFACDVLVSLHGADASWERFDVRAFEQYIREDAPGFVVALPSMLEDLGAFTAFLAQRGRLAFERHVETLERLVAVSKGAGSPMPPPNRAERRAAARHARRRH